MIDLNKPDLQIDGSEGGEPPAYALVYATFPSMALAEAAGGVLVDEGLAACVNILSGMTSIYRWQGERHREDEVVMLVKTRASLVDAVIARTVSVHPYDNPAILAVPVVGGAQAFLHWIGEQTTWPAKPPQS